MYFLVMYIRGIINSGKRVQQQQWYCHHAALVVSYISFRCLTPLHFRHISPFPRPSSPPYVASTIVCVADTINININTAAVIDTFFFIFSTYFPSLLQLPYVQKPKSWVKIRSVVFLQLECSPKWVESQRFTSKRFNILLVVATNATNSSRLY